MSYGITHTGSSEISSSASVPVSKPSETKGLSDWSVTSAAVTLGTTASALYKEKAPLCGGERKRGVRVCLGSC